MFLEKIKGPESVKELDAVERQTLIEEMRTALLLRAVYMAVMSGRISASSRRL